MKSEIIAVGSEMLTPFRQDTNSLYLTERLNSIGVTVAFKTIVGDRKRDLVNSIRTALARVDILVIMGGLGPTEDDLTREAVGEALSIKLRRDANLVVAGPNMVGVAFSPLGTTVLATTEAVFDVDLGVEGMNFA